MGSAGQGLLLAPVLLPSARSQLRQPRRETRADARRRLLVRPRRRRSTARRGALPLRARRHDTARTSPRPTPSSTSCADTSIASTRQDAARRGQPMARRRGCVLRPGQSLPHGVSFSDHAAALHGGAHRRSLSADRHLVANAEHTARRASGHYSCATTTNSPSRW